MRIDVELNRKDRQQAQQLREDMRKLNTDLLTDSEASRKADAQLVQKHNKEMIALLITKKTEELRAIAELKRAREQAADEAKYSFEGMTDSIMGGVKGLGAMAVGMVGVGSAGAAVGAIVQYFKDANVEIQKSAKFMETYRDTIKELAALKEKTGTQALGEEFKFRAATLMTAPAATAFQASALGTGLPVVGEGPGAVINRKEFDIGMERIAQQSMQRGESPEAAGTMAGTLPTLMGGKNLKGEDVSRRYAQLFQIMQAGGPLPAKLMDAYGKISGMVGTVYTDRDLAALMSAYSLRMKAEEAATHVQQFTRATVGSISKSGKPRIDDAEPIGRYMKELGIDKQLVAHTKPTDLPFLIGERLTADLDKQKKAAEARGEFFNQMTYLQGKGYSNQEDLSAVQLYQQLKTSGVLDPIMAAAKPEAEPSAEKVKTDIEKFQRTDPRAQTASAQIQQERGKAMMAMRTHAEYFKDLYAAALGRIQARPGGEHFTQSADELANQYDWGFNELVWGQREKMEMEAQHLLAKEAQRVGVAFNPPRAWNKAGAPELFAGKDELYRLAERIGSAGGFQVPGMANPDIPLGAAVQQQSRFEGTPAADPAALNRHAAALEKHAAALEKTAPAAPQAAGVPVPNVTPNVKAR